MNAVNKQLAEKQISIIKKLEQIKENLLDVGRDDLNYVHLGDASHIENLLDEIIKFQN